MYLGVVYLEIMKLVSVNIEGDKHLPLVRALLEKEMPDVVCMCEVLKMTPKNLLNN